MLYPYCPVCQESVKTSTEGVICEKCGYNQSAKNPKDIEVEPQEAKELLNKGTVLIDVRRDDEVETAKIEGSVHIQLDTLSQNLSKLDKSKPIITHCHHGVRSLHAARFLRQKGFNARSMKGGIDQWSEEVDQSVPTY